jgi:hypothetical protein
MRVTQTAPAPAAGRRKLCDHARFKRAGTVSRGGARGDHQRGAEALGRTTARHHVAAGAGVRHQGHEALLDHVVEAMRSW